MDYSVIDLADDLDQKFKELCSMQDLPELYLTDYFSELRNRIDIDAEKKLAESDTRSDDSESEETPEVEPARVNELRENFISILKKIEEDLLRELPLPLASGSSSSQVYAALGQRIDEFRKNPDNDGNRGDLEDAYISLAQEIFDKSSQLEAQLFRNQTICYVNAYRKLGHLVYIKQEHLNKTEIETLSLPAIVKENYGINDVYLSIEKVRNRAMKVYSLRPFIVTRSMLLIHELLRGINDDTEMDCFCIGDLPSSLEGNHDKNLKLKLIEADGFDRGELFNSLVGIEGFEDKDQIFEGPENPCADLSCNRLTELSPHLSALFKTANYINISQNQLARLDEDLLEPCANLEVLRMLKSCSPDATFALDFLGSLSLLNDLEITLPVGPADFSIFQPLNFLKVLVLEGISSIDATKKRTKLTQDSFCQLSELPALETLKLSYFELNSLDQKMLAEFRELTELSLANNRISYIDVDTFSNCPSHLSSLDLSGNQLTNLPARLFTNQEDLENLNIQMNSLQTLDTDCFVGLTGLTELHLEENQIEDLPIGVFDSLSRLTELNLSNNSISAIKCGVFENTVSLQKLHLNHNLISSLGIDSFRNLTSLYRLEIDNCQLKSINDRMFTGLVKLEDLSLDDNQISSFEVVSEFNSIRLDKANLSSLELEAARNHLFKDLSNLTTLSLKGNRLERLDLNLFCNLAKLDKLDLSKNAINELNDKSNELNEHNLASLKTLNLQHNQLTAIGKNAFSCARKLERLYLSFNKLEKFDDDFFTSFVKLELMNLANNNLTFKINRHTFSEGGRRLLVVCFEENKTVQIEDGAFGNATSLRHLSNDLITSFLISAERNGELPRMSFRYERILIHKSTPEVLKLFLLNEMNSKVLQRSLNTLSLTNCLLESLDEFDLGAKFTIIISLDLSGNQLRELKSYWIEGLVQLRHLNLSKNCLEELDDSELFKNLEYLVTVNLSHNRLKRLNRDIFNGRISLESIDLSSNPELSSIDPTLFRELDNLKQINLSGNNIQSLNLRKLIEFCPSLRKLDLSRNQLDNGSINATSMRRGDQLQELKLARNRLVKMDFVFNLVNLEQLDLSGNQISSLIVDEVNCLGRLMNIEKLDLSCNQIESFEEEMIVHLRPNLAQLNLSGNPFDLKEPDILKKIKWLPSPNGGSL